MRCCPSAVVQVAEPNGVRLPWASKTPCPASWQDSWGEKRSTVHTVTTIPNRCPRRKIQQRQVVGPARGEYGIAFSQARIPRNSAPP
eukprot:7102716-Alexandrium_andersonii.AAC.1